VLGTPCLYLACLPCCTKGKVGRGEQAINLDDGPSPDTYLYLLSLALAGQKLDSSGSQAEPKGVSHRQRFVLLPTVSKSQNHRITECSGLEGTSVGHPVQHPLCPAQLVTQLYRCS